METSTAVDLKKDEHLVDIERVQHPDEFKAFAFWLSLPKFMRRPPRDKNGNTPSVRQFAESMGMDDDDAIAFLEIPTATAFGEKYGISNQTLTAWKKAIKAGDPMSDIREWANDLNTNVVFSLYNKTIQGGMAEHYALWFKLIAGWSEKIRIEKRTIRTITLKVHHVDAKPV